MEPKVKRERKGRLVRIAERVECAHCGAPLEGGVRAILKDGKYYGLHCHVKVGLDAPH